MSAQPIWKIYSVIFVGVVLLGLGYGCAGTGESHLYLESVMSVKQQRAAQARENARRSEEQKKSEAERLKNLHERLAASKFKTPELELLELPSSFQRISEEELEAQKKESPDAVPPFTEALWRDSASGVTITAGRTDLNLEKFQQLSREGFRAELEKIEPAYDEYYQKTYNSHATVQIREANSLFIVTVTAKYLQGKDWYSDLRYAYIYKLDFRVNVFVSGRDLELTRLAPELNQSLQKLEERIALLHPAELQFKPSDTP